MTGWRIGFAVGRKEVIAGLGKVKTNIDSGVFQAIQEAGITALQLDDSVTEGLRTIYQERRDVLVPGLKSHGIGTGFASGGVLRLDRCAERIYLGVFHGASY